MISSKSSFCACRFVIVYLVKIKEVEEYRRCEFWWTDYYILATSFEDSVHKLFCFHMYRPVQSREREEGLICIVASVYGMIDCY